MFDQNKLMEMIKKRGGMKLPEAQGSNGAPFNIDQIFQRFESWFKGLDPSKRAAFVAEVSKTNKGAWAVAKRHGFTLK